MKSLFLFVVIGACVCIAPAAPIVLVHQGRLTSGNAPLNGTFDLRFSVYDSSSVGVLIQGPVEVTGVSVTDGLFAAEVTLDDSSFDGTERWFEIEVAESGVGSWFTLSPRQRVGVTPEAAHANRADHADTADTAVYALDGPFVRAGLTAESGVPAGATSTTQLTMGGNPEVVQLAAPIEIVRNYAYSNGEPVGSEPIIPVFVVVRRPYLSGPSWLQDYPSGQLMQVLFEIETVLPGFGATVWTFDRGQIAGYELVSGTADGAYEQLTLVFALDRQADLIASITRDVTPDRDPVVFPGTPTLGRATVPAGGPPGTRFEAFWDRSALQYEVVEHALLIESDVSTRGDVFGVNYPPVTLRQSVLADSRLFNALGDLTPREYEVRLEDGGGPIVTPYLGSGLVIGITLTQLSDGFLVEDYELAPGAPRP